MFCIYCGTQNADGNRFCISCGKPLNPEAAPSDKPAPATTEDLSAHLGRHSNAAVSQPAESPAPAPAAAPEPPVIPAVSTPVSGAAQAYNVPSATSIADEPTEATIVIEEIPFELHLMRIDNQKHYPITKFPSVLGRSSTSPVPLADQTTISRDHARITLEGDQFYIADCGSTNGTQVEGVLLDKDIKAPLTNGAQLTLADVQFVVIINPV